MSRRALIIIALGFNLACWAGIVAGINALLSDGAAPNEHRQADCGLMCECWHEKNARWLMCGEKP